MEHFNWKKNIIIAWEIFAEALISMANELYHLIKIWWDCNWDFNTSLLIKGKYNYAQINRNYIIRGLFSITNLRSNIKLIRWKLLKEIFVIYTSNFDYDELSEWMKYIAATPTLIWFF